MGKVKADSGLQWFARVRVQMAEEGRSPDLGQCGGTCPAQGTKILGEALESPVLVWL